MDRAGGKVGKGQNEWEIGLEATTDILCDVAEHRGSQFLVGFAAEYGLEGLGRAREKMERKSLDMIVFNDISRTDIGFDSDYNEVRILTARLRGPDREGAERDRRRDSSWTTSRWPCAAARGRPRCRHSAARCLSDRREEARLVARLIISLYRGGEILAGLVGEDLGRSPSWPGSLPRP